MYVGLLCNSLKLKANKEKLSISESVTVKYSESRCQVYQPNKWIEIFRPSGSAADLEAPLLNDQ